MMKCATALSTACLAMVCAAADVSEYTAVQSEVTTCSPTQETYFKGRSLANVRGLSLDGYQKFGGETDTHTYTIFADEASTGAATSGYYTKSGLLFYSNLGSTLTVEFHGVCTYGNSYNGIGNGFELKLTQSGEDILGEVTWMAGFTGANDYLDTTWAEKKKSNFNDWNSSTATYSTCGSNLVLYFSDEAVTYTVSFKDWDGGLISEQTVAVGQSASAPADPVREGYKFIGWDGAYTAVQADTTVTALYHKWCNVRFEDADGTLLSEQTVEETMDAVEPDMSGRTYNGLQFIGWSAEFTTVGGDITIVAQYGTAPDVVKDIAEKWDLPANALIWDCEETAWNDSSRHWYTPGGVIKPWRDGAIAVFPKPITLSVYGSKKVGGIIVACEGDVVLTGDSVELDAPASVVFYEDGKLRFENDVKGSAGLVQNVRDANDVFIPGTTYDSEIEGELTATEDEPQLLFKNVSLENVQYIKGRMTIKFGGSSPIDLLLSSAESPKSNGGVFYYSNDGQVLTAQFQGKSSGSYSGVYHCIKVKLVQNGADVNGWVEYSRSGTVKYDKVPALGEDWDACSATSYKQQIYDIKVGVPDKTIYDVLPSDVAIEIAGDYSVAGTLLISNGVFKTVGMGTLGGGTAFAEEVKIANGGTLAFASAADQKFGAAVKKLTNSETGSVVFESGCNVTLNTSAEARRIYLPVSVKGNLTLPDSSSVYHVFYSSPSVDVYDGGVVKIGNGYLYYGHREAKITCHEGGLVQYTSVRASGAADTFIAIDGGELKLYDDYSDKLGDDTATKLMILSNGATVTGEMMTWAWSRTTNAIAVRGTAPCYFNAPLVRLGQKSEAASSNKKMIQRLAVDDATGNDEADLTVAARLFLNSETTWARENEEFCGMEKTGAGTVLFTAANSVLAGSLKVKDGTVAFGDEASLSGMSLWLQGGSVDFGSSKGSAFDRLKLDEDSCIKANAKSRITFADSSEMSWTEGKKLVLKGDMGPRSIRVGTSAAALTPGQLAAIVYEGGNGRQKPVTIDSEGYLHRPPSSMKVIMR